jgi:hypothetical protein
MVRNKASVTGFEVSQHRVKEASPYDYGAGPTPIGSPSDVLAVDFADNGPDTGILK